MSVAATTTAVPATTGSENPSESGISEQWAYQMPLEIYERIGEQGLIPRETHVVLLDGALIQTMTKGPDHTSDVTESYSLLTRIVPEGWHVRQEQPIALRGGLRGDSMPEPDLALVIGRNGQFRRRHPEAAEVSVLVEVASTPAAFADDRAGLSRYAHAGIPTVLIVRIFDRSIHVYTMPSGPGTTPSYAQVDFRRAGDLIELDLRPLVIGSPPVRLRPLAVGSFFAPDL